MSNEIAAPHHHQHPNHHHHLSTSRHLNNNKITDVPSGKSLVVSLTDDVSFPDQETDLIVQIDKKPDPGDKSNLTVEEGGKKKRVQEEDEGIRSISCSQKETNGLQSVESNEATQDVGDPLRPPHDEQEVEGEEMSSVILTPSHSSGSPSTDESHLLDRTVGSETGCGVGLGTFEEHYGFAADPSDMDDVEFYDNDSNAFNERLAELEEEQEQLNSSLIALTSHFAQVQFRLKQIVDANSDERERLLKELEEFAFRGIPDTRNASFLQQELNSIQNLNSSSSECNDARPHKLDRQREKQKELMQKLKNQLEDLEKYAYETGDMNVIPSSMLIERQSVIIEQLKGKLALNLEEMDRLSLEELRKQVDQALKDLINPVIMKEQLVQQLKTQVTDLERFIQYLQSNEGNNALSSSGSAKCAKNSGRCTCSCPLHGNSQTAVQAYNEFVAAERLRQVRNNGDNNSTPDSQEAIKMIKRLMTLLNMITFAQFGCNRAAGSKHFERNILKKTSRAGSHWGDLRAKLEIAIDHLIETNKEISSKFCNDSDYTSDSDDNAFVPVSNEKITSIVRKELATSLRELMEHGLIDYEADSGGSSLIVTHILDWGCFPTRSSQVSTDYRKGMTAWDLILKYYEIKEGDHFRAAPARSLSQSFNLHIVGGTTITPRQNLLIAIADVIESHAPFKRRPESHFKAFVSRGLNEGKLATWIRLIVKNRKLVENFYEPWSYTASTGFQDAIKSLDKLSAIKFDLPTDLSVRQLSGITDAF